MRPFNWPTVKLYHPDHWTLRKNHGQWTWIYRIDLVNKLFEETTNCEDKLIAPDMGNTDFHVRTATPKKVIYMPLQFPTFSHICWIHDHYWCLYNSVGDIFLTTFQDISEWWMLKKITLRALRFHMYWNENRNLWNYYPHQTISVREKQTSSQWSYDKSFHLKC